MRRLNRPQVLDLAVALAFAIAGVVDVLTNSKAEGPDWANVAGALGIGAALLLRRHWPVATALSFYALLFTFAIWLSPPPEMVVAFFGLLFFPYAAGAWGTARGGAVVLAGIPLTIAGVDLIVGHQSPVGDAVFPSILGIACFLVGRTVASRTQLAAELHEAAVLAQEEREADAAKAVADERRRIARELHDVVAHSISVMVVQAGGARRILQTDPARAVAAAAQIERAGREALLEMRRLLGALHPREGGAALAPQPGMDGLGALIERARAAGLPVELRVEGERRPLPPGMDLAAYRILQEALTNALKHTGAAPTDVRVRWSHDAVELEVTDRGPGPAGAALDGGGGSDAGQGLIGMRERVRLYGGELHTGRRRGGGFEVKARIPFQTEEVA